VAPGGAVIMSPHGCHRLIRNKYLATAFDHDLSTTAEAALFVIYIDSFLRDPKGLTCTTLHFSPISTKCSPAILLTGRRVPCCPGFKRPVDGCNAG